MKELLPDIERWRDAGKKVAVATVVQAYGSAPRRPGAKMAISEDGEFVGSVSGGCVENDVVEHAKQVIEEDHPRLVPYGISDEMAFNVGLACGGQIEVFIQPFRQGVSRPRSRSRSPTSSTATSRAAACWRGSSASTAAASARATRFDERVAQDAIAAAARGPRRPDALRRRARRPDAHLRRYVPGAADDRDLRRGAHRRGAGAAGQGRGRFPRGGRGRARRVGHAGALPDRRRDPHHARRRLPARGIRSAATPTSRC